MSLMLVILFALGALTTIAMQVLNSFVKDDDKVSSYQTRYELNATYAAETYVGHGADEVSDRENQHRGAPADDQLADTRSAFASLIAGW
jgi:hypothetical protein